MIKTPIPSFVFAAVLALAPTSARAAVIVANTGSVAGTAGQSSSLNFLAAGFISPSVATTITSVDLPLEEGSGAPTVLLSLYSDNGGVPGSPIAALGQQNVNGAATYTFTPAAPVGIGASTSYWLVLECPNCVVGVITNNWGESSGFTLAGLPGANVVLGVGFSADGGTSWDIFDPDRAFVFRVNGDPVTVVAIPTLSGWSLTLLTGLLVLAGVVLVRRRLASG